MSAAPTKLALGRVFFVMSGVSLFSLLPWLKQLDSLVAAACLMGLCMVAALAVSSSLQALSVMAGSVAALVGGLAFESIPGLTGGAMLGLLFAERTTRVRGRGARIVHQSLAFLGGAVSAMLAAHYVERGMTTHVVVSALVAVLIMLPLVLEADDPVAHELERLASELSGEIAEHLRLGACLRRDGDSGLLDQATRSEVRASWSSLMDVSRARVRIEADRGKGSAHRLALIARLDGRIEQHVTALGRTFTAAQEVRAAEASLDDDALRKVETSGESLEQISRALVD